jgi:tRNA A-37 threonylcarbamoyl transferase component Bud32
MNQQIPITTGIDGHELPDGYVQLKVAGKTAIACQWAAPVISEILAGQTLHAWAADQSHERMIGRGINYAVTLPAGMEPASNTAVVIRRNRHGGLLRAVTGELFVSPSRAPLELAVYLRLASAGVNTPEMIAFATYPALLNLVRCDVVTRRLPPGGDFPDIWKNSDAETRDTLLIAAAELLNDLTKAGAWHADLNLKNIYISDQGNGLTPYILDIDRVTFPVNKDVAARNFNRLARSARKWRDRWGLDFTEKDIERLAALAKEKC